MNLVEVKIWGKLVGVLFWNEEKQVAVFEYAKTFLKQKIELSPLINPLSSNLIKAKVKNSNTLDLDTDKLLPLFISDSMPDKFGTELLSKYLQKEGKNYKDLNPLEKLSYIGNRGMGALEFIPAKQNTSALHQLDLKELNKISKSLMRNEPIGNLQDMTNLFHIGTSPGGAQPKVLINIDRLTGDIFRGDNIPTENQDSWILKFNRSLGEDFENEHGKIEYAYFLMAKDAKINMMDSEIIEIGNESFFMTKRFDRVNSEKIHTQTLHAFAGMNFRLPNTYSYEQIFTVFNKIGFHYPEKEQLFRIMVFNMLGRNVDDHTKNFGFNKAQNGSWQFSPAYDITFSYNENYNRETPHFLSVNGKNEGINLADILLVAKAYSIKNPKRIINEINQSLLKWPEIANSLNISEKTRNYISTKLTAVNYTIK